MATPTADTHTHTASCMRTSAKPVTQRFLTESPLHEIEDERAAESLREKSDLEYAKIVGNVEYLYKYTYKGEQHSGFSSFFFGDVINQVDPAGPAAERAAKACSAGEGEAAAAGG